MSKGPRVVEPYGINRSRIIGIYGSKGVGKDFVGNQLREYIIETQGSGYVNLMALADPIKDYAIKNLGIPRALAYGSDEDKNTLTDYLWERMPFKHDKKGRMSVREILQTLGTELGRDVWGNNIWLNAMHNRIDEIWAQCCNRAGFDQDVPLYSVVTDVRFDNEVEEVRSWGGVVWGIKGPQRIKKTGDSHRSELQHDIEFDAVVINDGGTTREQIRDQIKENLQRWLSTTSTDR